MHKKKKLIFSYNEKAKTIIRRLTHFHTDIIQMQTQYVKKSSIQVKYDCHLYE